MFSYTYVVLVICYPYPLHGCRFWPSLSPLSVFPRSLTPPHHHRHYNFVQLCAESTFATVLKQTKHYCVRRLHIKCWRLKAHQTKDNKEWSIRTEEVWEVSPVCFFVIYHFLLFRIFTCISILESAAWPHFMHFALFNLINAIAMLYLPHNFLLLFFSSLYISTSICPANKIENFVLGWNRKVCSGNNFCFATQWLCCIIMCVCVYVL